MVAHHVSMVVVQAEAGAAGAEAVGDDAAATRFDGIADTGRVAMSELRRLLGVLREDTERQGTEPQPGIAAVPDLVARVRAAGLPVDLVTEGEPRTLPDGIDVSAYRIVQEALTNVVRHAGSVPTTVRIGWSTSAVELDVTDEGARTPDASASHDGGGRRRRRRARPRGHPRAGRAARRLAAGRSPRRRRLRGGRPPADAGGRCAVTDRSERGGIGVLVVDDQPVVREGFAAVLSAQPDIEVVGEAADGRAAVELAQRLRPDVVLMDVRMPVLDGLTATRLLAGPDVSDPLAVIVLTTFDLDEYVYEALRAGAAGFLLKDTTRDDLAAAVRLVAGGDALLAPDGHPPADRRVRPAAPARGRPGRRRPADRARAGGARADRPRSHQRRDRRRAVRG